MSLECLRPTIRFLSDPLIERILAEAREVLAVIGVTIANDEVTDLLLASGAVRDDNGRILFPAAIIDDALGRAPSSFNLYDRDGELCAELGGMNVHFTPGSAAINVLDYETGRIRRPTTADYVRYVRLVDQLDAIDYQSTAFIPADVHELVSDSYRLYLSLLYGRSPVVTGAFTIDAFEVLADLLLAVRGDERALADKPLALFSCCPTAPLKWSDVTSQNVIDCARMGIPVEYISMPLTGFVAPGTLVGTLVQHAAETLTGLVISQVAAPGAPVLWGGSPAIFDYRYETTPMGAIETQMVDCAYAEIGRALNLPTQAYISLSDSKRVDAQAGLEGASGATLAALAGINSISGPGMLDFESCQSLEKLVLDNEICARSKRLIAGIAPREGDFPALPHFHELLDEGHLLIADHTRTWFPSEVRFPGDVIDRANRERYLEQGGLTLEQRAHQQVERLLENEPDVLDDARRQQLEEVMRRAARVVGMDDLPAHE